MIQIKRSHHQLSIWRLAASKLAISTSFRIGSNLLLLLYLRTEIRKIDQPFFGVRKPFYLHSQLHTFSAVPEPEYVKLPLFYAGLLVLRVIPMFPFGAVKPFAE